ncbi:ATP12 family chaperone protein [Sphingomonas alba]|uniref:ATPase n=1 Tax=Sphingomonas alba TaxID=2908208 RepID=A0ABT0RPY5_9SPHN|nr:ATP12 family protein [Sphingomonas alba]MCL6684693.1 ATPase [Sphingomonas alba]
MKRFWKEARAVAADGGWTVELDGKPLRTPARQPLVVPTEALARGIAREWNGSGESIDPRAMPLTGLANAAIDRVGADPGTFAAGLAKYGEGDLLCYRANSQEALAQQQEREWAPLLAWARRRYDVDFQVTAGITHVPQPESTVQQLGHGVASLDPFRLAGLSPLVTIGGSLVAALMIVEEAIAAEDAWSAVTLDERWQMEQWGVDEEAVTMLANRRADFLAGASFLELLA